MSEPIIISIHNYKSAGVTFYSIIDRQFKKDEILNSDLLGMDDTYLMLSQADEKIINKIKIIHGHFPFGLDRLLPQKSTYITFLRNPIERLISDYYYCKDFALAHNHSYASTMSFKEYLSCSDILNIDNGQTRFVAGGENVPYGDNSIEMLNRAIENIEKRFSFVGITEKFDESLLIANAVFSWNQYYYTSKNITSSKSYDFDEETWELLRKRNFLDLQLYEYALKKHAGDLKKIPYVKLKMILLKTLKSLFVVTKSIYAPVKKRFFR
ncbi:sulfotransferase family 2 domain-containing protein [Cytophaga hutchinsonii]|uniref:Uncharacterized protein n=1 Tax=Cytophaga hutchinsonii (strain ATCC 33406 / DSM 1761 / CIP 103989 / NBRC 15051 / NCIMB 9469 / D465) TaxID=269798 RepID=A0A6N4SPH0_CYTH3|nr:sulfotransferase family 2 domain-containing protein [Cytophaga hutchinsonii]ABG58138.1 conserved hypothetical protein [Cytophaga hutchinsonii ATCC 33406]SFX14427.1 Galactose-3-O-sulfotransferase [Cytophaga hutchinsonii ATCC 33406]